MNEWYYMKEGDDTTIHYEDGSSVPLTPHHYTLPFGKYQGLTLAELTDLSYLSFLAKIAAEKKDWFLQTCVALRVKEFSS